MATQFLKTIFTSPIFNVNQTSKNHLSKVEAFTMFAENIENVSHEHQLDICKYVIGYPYTTIQMREIGVEIINAINILLKPSDLLINNSITMEAHSVLYVICINIVGFERAFNGGVFNKPSFNQFLSIFCDISGENFKNISMDNIGLPFRNQDLFDSNKVVFGIDGEEVLVPINTSYYAQLLTRTEVKLNDLISVHIRNHKPYVNGVFNQPAIFDKRDDFFGLCLRMTCEQLEEFINTGTMPPEDFFNPNFSGVFTELKKISTIRFAENINKAEELESKETKETGEHLPEFSTRRHIVQRHTIISNENKIVQELSFKTPETAGRYIVRFLECASTRQIHAVVELILEIEQPSELSPEIQSALKLIKKHQVPRVPGQMFSLREIKVLFIAYVKLFGITREDDFEPQKLRKYLRDSAGREFNIEPLFVIVEKINQNSVTVRINGEALTIEQNLQQVKLIGLAMGYTHACMVPPNVTHPYFIEDETRHLCQRLREYSGTTLTQTQINQTTDILHMIKLRKFPESKLRELLKTMPCKEYSNSIGDAQRAVEVFIERYRVECAKMWLIAPPIDTESVMLFREQPDKWFKSLEDGRFSTSGLNQSITGKSIIYFAIRRDCEKKQNSTELDKFIQKFEKELDNARTHNLLAYDAMKKIEWETLALGEMSLEEDPELRTYLSRFSTQQLSDFIQTVDIINFVKGVQYLMPERIKHLHEKRLQRIKFIDDAKERINMRNECAQVNENMKIEGAQVNENMKIEGAKVNENMKIEDAVNNGINSDEVFKEFDRIFYGKSDTKYLVPVISFDDFFENEFGLDKKNEVVLNLVKPSAPSIDQDEFERLCNKVIEPSAPYIDDII